MKHLTASEIIELNRQYWDEHKFDLPAIREWQEKIFKGLMDKLKLRGDLHTMVRRRYGQHIHVFPQPANVYEASWLDLMFRANGEVDCRFCRRPYNAHPQHPDYPNDPTLVVTCLGWAVKT